MNQAILTKISVKTEDELHCYKLRALGKSFLNEVSTNMNQAMLTIES